MRRLNVTLLVELILGLLLSATDQACVLFINDIRILSVLNLSINPIVHATLFGCRLRKSVQILSARQVILQRKPVLSEVVLKTAATTAFVTIAARMVEFRCFVVFATLICFYRGELLLHCNLGRLVFFSFFFHLTSSRWTASLPSCLWSQRIFPSLPGSRLTIF